MITIAVSVEKGGNAKSTTAVHLAHILAISGHRVLLIDADQNSHCAFLLGLEGSKDTARLFNPDNDFDRTGIMALTRSAHREAQDIPNADGSVTRIRPIWRDRLRVITSSRGSIISSRQYLALQSSNEEAGELTYHLTKQLAKIDDDFDFCIIDCPPGIDLFQRNIINAANIFVIPCTFGAADITGAETYILAVDKALGESAVNETAKDCCIVLPTKQVASNTNRNLLAAASAKFKSDYGVRTAATAIPEREVVRRASEFGITCFERAAMSRPDTPGRFTPAVTNDNEVAEAYTAFAMEVKLIGGQPSRIDGQEVANVA